jgi:hypothetical protein
VVAGVERLGREGNLVLFAEYVNALEVLGGWGWATRNRDQFKLLLDGFLAYAPGKVATFYETVAGDDRGDLADLLGLPLLPDIARAWADRAAEEVRQQNLLDEFARCAANLRQAVAVLRSRAVARDELQQV